MRTTGAAALVAFLLMSATPAAAQRIINELESNSERGLMQGDTIDGDKKAKKLVPVDVRAWTVDSKYGNRTPAIVDTLTHRYQNNDHPEGHTGHYNTLGNLGSPRLSRLYMERPDEHNFLFVNPFSQFFTPTESIRFYNTKSPYMNLSYNFCGSRDSGDDHFRATYANNVGRRFSFGAVYDYTYGQGYYANQSTAFMNATAFASYDGDKYDLHFYYFHNHMKWAENGGIEDETYITNPESLSQKYGAGDMPTNLTSTWGRQDHDVAFLSHRYNLGFYRTEGDSTDLREVFVPVTSFFHTLKVQKMDRRYISNTLSDAFYDTAFLPGDSARDKTSYLNVRTLAGLTLHEGFNKWAAAGLKAYIGLDYTRYELPDTLSGGLQTRTRHSESDIVVGGQLIRTQGHTLHYNVDAEFVAAGEHMGDLDVRGRAELNVPLMRDTLQVAVNAFIKNKKPSYYYEHLHSKYAWWDTDLDKVMRTRIEGEVNFARTRTHLKAGVENIKNYTYLADSGTQYQQSGVTRQTHTVSPAQSGKSIQVVSATLRQDFRLGILNMENEVTYQKSSDEDALPLPALSTYHNLYIKFRIAKVLGCELGADLKYFTEYYAPTYSPAATAFATQNPLYKEKIGNYPLISAYVNFDLKRTRFYVQYYHANQGTGRYFWAPGYPMNPAGLHMGLSWNFYD